MDTASLVMLVALIAIFYFLVIRPENKRKKAAEELRNGLKKGDKLTTIGGIVGTIVQVGNDTLIIETSEDRVRLEITKWAVSTTGVQTGETVDNKKKKEKTVSDEVPEEPAAPEIAEPASDSGNEKE